MPVPRAQVVAQIALLPGRFGARAVEQVQRGAMAGQVCEPRGGGAMLPRHQLLRRAARSRIDRQTESSLLFEARPGRPSICRAHDADAVITLLLLVPRSPGNKQLGTAHCEVRIVEAAAAGGERQRLSCDDGSSAWIDREEVVAATLCRAVDDRGVVDDVAFGVVA